MRTSLSWVAVILMALAVNGCSKKDDASKDDDSSSSSKKKSKSKKASDDDDEEEGDKGKKGKSGKKTEDDEEASNTKASSKKSKGVFTATLEGTEVPMKYGRAMASFTGSLEIVLSNEKVGCSYA